MDKYFSLYQNWVGLLDPKLQLIISGLIVFFILGIFFKFFIKNLFLIIIFLLFAPLYWPVLKNFLVNLVNVFR